MTGFQVRLVSADDWALFAEVRLEALRRDPEAFCSSHADWAQAGEDRWRARLAEPATWIALCEGMACGVVGVTRPGPDRVELISMWVDPSARGLGVGDALVRSVLDWARAQAPGQRVGLEVFEGNLAAQKLYLRNGFEFTEPPTGDPRGSRPMLWRPGPPHQELPNNLKLPEPELELPGAPTRAERA